MYSYIPEFEIQKMIKEACENTEDNVVAFLVKAAFNRQFKLNAGIIADMIIARNKIQTPFIVYDENPMPTMEKCLSIVNETNFVDNLLKYEAEQKALKMKNKAPSLKKPVIEDYKTIQTRLTVMVNKRRAFLDQREALNQEKHDDYQIKSSIPFLEFKHDVLTELMNDTVKDILEEFANQEASELEIEEKEKKKKEKKDVTIWTEEYEMMMNMFGH